MNASELVRYCVICFGILGAVWCAFAYPASMWRPRFVDYVVGAFVGVVLGVIAGLFASLVVSLVVWLASGPRWII